MYTEFIILGIAVIIALLGVIAQLTLLLLRARKTIESMTLAEKRSSTTSRAVIKGQIVEQLYPLLPDCPFEFQDMKFLGQPFDYLALRGYSAGEITEVVFVELKTGTSRLSPIQQSLRRCIEQGGVSWRTVRIGA